jgi:two-component system response regulator PilR (NtrC family)
MQTTKILFADDDLLLGTILSKELRSFGYDVHFVLDGEEAISQLRHRKYDLAILDIRMPKVDGYGVLKFIKQEQPKVKVIMLTAYADLMHSVMSKEGGADEFMTKPYSLEDLRFTIHNLVNG